MCVYVCGIGNDAFTFCNFFGRRLAFFPRVCFVPTRRFTKVSGYCDEDPRIFVLYPPRAAPCHSSRLIEGFLRARADKKERATGASIWNLSLSLAGFSFLASAVLNYFSIYCASIPPYARARLETPRAKREE